MRWTQDGDADSVSEQTALVIPSTRGLDAVPCAALQSHFSLPAMVCPADPKPHALTLLVYSSLEVYERGAETDFWMDGPISLNRYHPGPPGWMGFYGDDGSWL